MRAQGETSNDIGMTINACCVAHKMRPFNVRRSNDCGLHAGTRHKKRRAECRRSQHPKQCPPSRLFHIKSVSVAKTHPPPPTENRAIMHKSVLYSNKKLFCIR